MDTIFEFIGKTVLAVGGAGVIITAVSAFISKYWADLYMKKKTAEYDKQIEYYKNILELEREKYKALNEQAIHKNKIIFDTEFEIYKELSPKLINAIDELFDYLIIKRLSDEYLERSQTKYLDLKSSLDRYASFIEKDMYELMRNLSSRIGTVIVEKAFTREDKYKDYKNINNEINRATQEELYSLYKSINDDMNEVIDKIREYLRRIAEIQ